MPASHPAHVPPWGPTTPCGTPSCSTRVDGQFTGTTDEILQWAACKWGLPDNLIRADAFVESTWFQAMKYSNGQCVNEYGCGDFPSTSTAAGVTYCGGVASLGGVDYQQWDGAGLCPQTFSILGIMSWWDPAWGFSWAGNQNGRSRSIATPRRLPPTTGGR